jgi:hypothetical protein
LLIVKDNNAKWQSNDIEFKRKFVYSLKNEPELIYQLGAEFWNDDIKIAAFEGFEYRINLDATKFTEVPKFLLKDPNFIKIITDAFVQQSFVSYLYNEAPSYVRNNPKFIESTIAGRLHQVMRDPSRYDQDNAVKAAQEIGYTLGWAADGNDWHQDRPQFIKDALEEKIQNDENYRKLMLKNALEIIDKYPQYYGGFPPFILKDENFIQRYRDVWLRVLEKQALSMLPADLENDTFFKKKEPNFWNKKYALVKLNTDGLRSI